MIKGKYGIFFSSEKEKNAYFKKERQLINMGNDMFTNEDHEIEDDVDGTNFEYIVCKDYSTYIEVFFASNVLKHLHGRGLKILSNCDFNHNLSKNFRELRKIILKEDDLKKCEERLQGFCQILDEKITSSAYDFSKEYWQIQLNQILSEFSLAKREIDFLTVIFHIEFHQSFNTAIESSGANSFNEYFILLEAFFGFPPKYFNGILNDGMPLVELGIIEISWNTTRDFCTNVEISGNLIAAVNSVDSSKNIMSFFYGIEKTSKLKIDLFKSYQSDVDKVKKILQKSIVNKVKGINILLYGPPGAGKTEFAKSLASELAVDLVVVENSGQGNNRISRHPTARGEGLSTWLFSIKLCGKMAQKLGNCILFLDDADSLLLLDDESHHRHRFSSKHRSKLLKLLEENEIPIIWVVNFNAEIDVAVKRRFTWNVEFKRPNAKERIQIWNNIIHLKGLSAQLDENEIKRLAFTYEAQPAIIENSLRIGQLLADDVVRIEDVEESLIKSLTLINNVSKESIDGSNHLVSKNYNLDLINTSIPLQNLVKSIQTFTSKTPGSNRLKSICMCLMGQPGTGKTEFVKYLGAHLHKKIIFIKASDLQNMMGPIESKLAEIFAEAEKEDAILFMDEVETFLSNRQNAIFSWEVAQVNETLTQLDNFKGIFIGATNCKNILDPACIRRFHFRVEFMPIHSNMKIATFQAFFPHITLPSVGLRSEFYKNLSSLKNLCLGDFKTVAVRTQFLNFDDPFYYLNELKTEVYAKTEMLQ